MPHPLTWLAVDTAMNACGVAVRRADGQLFSKIEPMERGQAERLVPLIQEVVAQAGLTLPQIDAYAIGQGPGTFTGLRVGLATVRALAQVSGKPAIGIGTFDAIEHAIADRPLCILIETKRSDYYVRAPGMDDGCLAPDQLAAIIKPEWILAGDAVERARTELSLANKSHITPSLPLESMIALAEKTPQNGLPEPVYLRGADVSTARRQPARIVQ